MKSLYLFGIFLLGTLATSSHAQSIQPVVRANAHTERAELELGKLLHLQARVQAIVLRRETIQNWENGAWVNNTRSTFDYSGELETEMLTEDWDGDSWTNAYRSVTSYTGNQVASIVFETWDGTSWVPEDRTLYTYSGGQTSEVIYQSYVNNAWVDEERSTITIANGVLVSEQTDVRQGQTWVPLERFSLEQEGDDVVAISEEWNGSVWINATRTVYNDLTLSEFWEAMQEFGEDSGTTYGFSFLLRMPDSVQQEWDGTQWVNVSRQVSERDGAGRPIVLRMEEWEDGAWVGETRYVATYNQQGELETVDWQMFADDWMSFLVETYTYDNAGLLERIVDQFNFGMGLTNSTQYLFEWTNTSTAVEDGEMPARIRLAAPYPNPFNPQTIVQYVLDSPEHASLAVFDATGRRVATLVDGMRPAGDHTVVFDAVGLSSGVYMIRLETPSYVETRAVTLLR